MTVTRSRRRIWLRVAILASPVAALVLLALWMRSSFEQATDAFVGESLDDWEQRFPAHEPDERACAIAAHSEALLPDRVDRARLRAMSAEERAGKSVRAGIAVRRLLGSARRATDDAPLPPEPAFTEWCSAHEAELGAAIDLLNGAEPPGWGWDPGRESAQEISWITPYRLNQVLLARAIDEHLHGHAAAAEAALRAAFALEEGIARRPDFPRIFGGVDGLAVLRLIRPSDAAAWIARIDAVDDRRDYADVVRQHALWNWRWAVRDAPADPEGVTVRGGIRLRGGLGRLVHRFDRMSLRVMAGRQVRRYARIEEALVAEGAACSDPVELTADAFRPPTYLQPWLGTRWDDDLGDPMPVLRRFELDAALTRRILALDAGLDASGGRCPALATQRLEPDGRFTVAWAVENGPSFTFRPRIAAEAPLLASAPTLSAP
jgi:hypothetical protein